MQEKEKEREQYSKTENTPARDRLYIKNMQKDLEKKHVPKINRTGLQVIKGSTIGTSNDDPIGFRYLPNGATSVGGAHRNSDNLQYKTLEQTLLDQSSQGLQSKEPTLEEDIIEKKL